MRKIAIVFGFSESCYELARQLIVSCHRAADFSEIDASYHFIAYECNYDLRKAESSPFQKECDLQKDIPIDSEILQIKSAHLKLKGPLPDISIYHHFARNLLDDYDYALFCHDDIYLKQYPVFREIVQTIDEPHIDLVAETSVACHRDLSIRFSPAFIFVRTDKFRRAGLSFVNNCHIFHDSMNAYPVNHDGGAGLLASYYRKEKTTKSMPLCEFPATWFKHLRFDTDYGVEMYNMLNPNGPQFNALISRAKQYADHFLYGTGRAGK